MFENLRNNITKTFQKLPGIRRPQNDSLLEQFMQDYHWAFQETNKNLGDIQAYYNSLNNPIVARCNQVYIDESIANGFSINNPDEEEVDPITTNYLTQLFQNPLGLYNPHTFSMLNSQIWTSWNITGDCFIEVNTDEVFDNVVNGFHFIPTEMVGYFDDTDQWGLRNTGYRYEADELIHIYTPSIRKRNYRWGTSIIDSIGSSVAVEFLGMKHNRELLDNDGLDPRGILSFDKDLSKQAVNNEIRRLMAEGKRKGTLAVQGATYSAMTNTNKDMDFISLMNYARDRIIIAFGVQPSKVGVRETASLGSGTGESQDKDFQKTLNGKCKLIEEQFNKVLGRHGFHEVFEYNREDLENKRNRADIENIRLNNGSLTINEVRSGYGEEPVEWGDEPYRNGSTGLGLDGILGTGKTVRPAKSPRERQVEIYKKNLKMKGLLK